MSNMGHSCQKCDKEFDEVIVEWIVAGNSPRGRICPVDAAEVIRRLAAQKWTDGQIAYLIGYSLRAVVRVRARHGIEAAFPKEKFRGSQRRVVPVPSLPMSAS